MLAALLATDYAFADTRHLQPLQTVQPFDRRSLRKFGDRDAVQHSATLEKRFGNTAAASADIAALMEHGWHGAPPGKSISEASAKPTSETKTKEKEGPKGKNTQKSEEPVTAEVIMQMAKTRWHKDSSRQETISRLYHDLPGKGKMGSGTGGAARPNFEFMVERHYNFGKEPQNAWRFLERGAKAKANFGPVHYKSWEVRHPFHSCRLYIADLCRPHSLFSRATSRRLCPWLTSTSANLKR